MTHNRNKVDDDQDDDDDLRAGRTTAAGWITAAAADLSSWCKHKKLNFYLHGSMGNIFSIAIFQWGNLGKKERRERLKHN